MLLFGNSPGRAGLFVDSSNAIPVTIYIGGHGETDQFTSVHLTKAVITSFDMKNEVNMSGTNTLRERIYFYILGGNKIPAITVGGYMFPGECHQHIPGCGLYDTLEYYEKYRASNYGLPVRITIDTLTVFKGFMKGLRTGINDPQFGLGEFTFEFMGLPRLGTTIPNFGPLAGATL